MAINALSPTHPSSQPPSRSFNISDDVASAGYSSVLARRWFLIISHGHHLDFRSCLAPLPVRDFDHGWSAMTLPSSAASKNWPEWPSIVPSSGLPAAFCTESRKSSKVSAVELVHRARYEDPADDTDKDLLKVPEDYGKSKNTKKQNV
ncbi:hypothetical protein VTN00DRAFT_2408 [Thermoascus crustaceus]|uniref:uncharacterized protein n=1 Tax=Thermoascus crustaceus TaxID=5088 RepID=UPI0037440222